MITNMADAMAATSKSTDPTMPPPSTTASPSANATPALPDLTQKLPNEIVQQIAIFVARAVPSEPGLGWSRKVARDLKNLSLISKRLHAHCSPLIFRDLVVT